MCTEIFKIWQDMSQTLELFTFWHTLRSFFKKEKVPYFHQTKKYYNSTTTKTLH